MCFIWYQVCFYRTKVFRSKCVVGINHRIDQTDFCMKLVSRTAVFVSSWNASPLGEERCLTRRQKPWLRGRLVRSRFLRDDKVGGSLSGRRRLVLISFYKAREGNTLFAPRAGFLEIILFTHTKHPRLLRRLSRRRLCQSLLSQKTLYSVLGGIRHLAGTSKSLLLE